MTLPNIFQPGTDVRAAWCAIIALAIAGAWSIENRFERPISASHVTIESLYRRTVVNERTVRQVAVLRREGMRQNEIFAAFPQIDRFRRPRQRSWPLCRRPQRPTPLRL